MSIQVKLVETDRELEAACQLLHQLRTQLSPEQIKERVIEQKAYGYSLAIAKVKNEYLGVAGFCLTKKLAWGNHIYVDDLVTDANSRSTGVGTALIDWLKAYGRKNNCTQLHLDSGVQRFDAHRFYLNQGFQIASHHFSISEL